MERHRAAQVTGGLNLPVQGVQAHLRDAELHAGVERDSQIDVRDVDPYVCGEEKAGIAERRLQSAAAVHAVLRSDGRESSFA